MDEVVPFIAHVPTEFREGQYQAHGEVEDLGHGGHSEAEVDLLVHVAPAVGRGAEAKRAARANNRSREAEDPPGEVAPGLAVDDLETSIDPHRPHPLVGVPDRPLRERLTEEPTPAKMLWDPPVVEMLHVPEAGPDSIGRHREVNAVAQRDHVVTRAESVTKPARRAWRRPRLVTKPAPTRYRSLERGRWYPDCVCGANRARRSPAATSSQPV